VTPSLQPPEPPLSDGVVTLRVPDPELDAASLRHFDDPEIVRWILGGPPHVTDPAARSPSSATGGRAAPTPSSPSTPKDTMSASA